MCVCLRVHYRDKGTVGVRLSLAGLSVAYHQPGLLYQGPWPSSAAIYHTQLILRLMYDGGHVPITVRQAHGFEVTRVAQYIRDAVSILATDMA